MPVMTRNQYKKEVCTRMFKDTIEDPCIFQHIAINLRVCDLISMKQVSKDPRFLDLVDYEIKKIKEHRDRINGTTRIIKRYLNSVEITRCAEAKIFFIKELYDFLCDNKWFVFDTTISKDFSKIVHGKLFNLIKDHPPFKEDAIKYLGILFDLIRPKDYYNHKLGIVQHGMFDIYNNFVLIDKL